MKFKGTKVFPKYEDINSDNTSIDMIFESGAIITIDRCNKYDENTIMTREEMHANAKLISCTYEMLEFINSIRLSETTPLVYRKRAENIIKKATS